MCVSSAGPRVRESVGSQCVKDCDREVTKKNGGAQHRRAFPGLVGAPLRGASHQLFIFSFSSRCAESAPYSSQSRKSRAARKSRVRCAEFGAPSRASTKLCRSLVGAPLRGATPKSGSRRGVCAKRDPKREIADKHLRMSLGKGRASARCSSYFAHKGAFDANAPTTDTTKPKNVFLSMFADTSLLQNCIGPMFADNSHLQNCIGLVFTNNGLLQNCIGLMFTNNGLLQNCIGLMFANTSLLQNCIGLVFTNNGLLQNCIRLVFANKGLLQNCIGLVFTNKGLLQIA